VAPRAPSAELNQKKLPAKIKNKAIMIAFINVLIVKESSAILVASPFRSRPARNAVVGVLRDLRMLFIRHESASCRVLRNAASVHKVEQVVRRTRLDTRAA